MLRRPLAASILVFLVIATAGCVVPFTSTDGAVHEVRYLDTFAGLTEDPPMPGHQALRWSLPEWFEGIPPPAWSTPHFDETRLVESAQVTITYSSDRTLLHSDTRPPFTIWFGVGDALFGNSIVEHAFAAGPNPWDGAAQTITFEVDSLPLGGLPVLSGQRLVLYVGSYYQDDSGTGAVHVEVPGSFVEYTHRPMEPPSGRYDGPVAATVVLAGGLCIIGVEVAESARAVVPVTVPRDADGLIVQVRNQEGAGIGPDIDFVLRDADGVTVAHAVGPGGNEGIYLHAPNMAAATPGGWTVELYNCQHQATMVRLSTQLFHSTL